jgi:hypothetical protein
MKPRQNTRCRIGSPFTADNEGFIDDHDVRRSGNPASCGLSACHSLSYTICTALRRDVDTLHIDDSKLQIDDFTLQIGDSTLQTGDSKLQIGNSKLQIVDFTVRRAGSDRRLDLTKLRMGDSIEKRPRGSSISAIRSFKSTIRSFKSVI